MVAAVDMIETIDPTTGEVLERIPLMSGAQLGAKLDAASRYAPHWQAASFEERANVLLAVARALRGQRDPLAEIAVREMGKPIVQARAEIEKCAWGLEYFAEHGAAM